MAERRLSVLLPRPQGPHREVEKGPQVLPPVPQSAHYRWELYPEVTTSLPRYWRVRYVLDGNGDVLSKHGDPSTVTTIDMTKVD